VSSAAFALIVTPPVTAAPSAGAVSAAVGAVVSGGGGVGLLVHAPVPLSVKVSPCCGTNCHE
jgi:hypothetical protein